MLDRGQTKCGRGEVYVRVRDGIVGEGMTKKNLYCAKKKEKKINPNKKEAPTPPTPHRSYLSCRDLQVENELRLFLVTLKLLLCIIYYLN